MSAVSRQSRRSLLAAAVGGFAAAVAGTLGRAHPTSAGATYVELGASNSASTVTSIENTTVGGDAVRVVANGAGPALFASSPAGYAIFGQSGSHVGVQGGSSSGVGVLGESSSGSLPAVLGRSLADHTGIQGYSGQSAIGAPLSPSKTGVYGYAAQDGAARGVLGETTGGIGVQGTATSGVGVVGWGDLDAGILGNSDSGDGVRGLSSTGIGVHASAAVNGTAFQADGRVRFSTAGLTAIIAPAKSRTITPGTDLTTASKILCTLESNQAGLAIQRVTKSTAAKTFKVFLNVAVQPGKTAKVAWFVIS